jgi:hypothetical protein
VQGRAPGRPRKSRIRSSAEGTGLGPRKRKCKRCGGLGHIARNCKNAVDPAFGEDQHWGAENALEIITSYLPSTMASDVPSTMALEAVPTVTSDVPSTVASNVPSTMASEVVPTFISDVPFTMASEVVPTIASDVPSTRYCRYVISCM